MKKICISIVVFIFLVSCQEPKKVEEFNGEPFIISQTFVKEKLKSPSSAKFPSEFETTYLGDSSFVVKSYFEAQNSFGALLKNNYKISLKFNGGKWEDVNNWRVIYLDIDK